MEIFSLQISKSLSFRRRFVSSQILHINLGLLHRNLSQTDGDLVVGRIEAAHPRPGDSRAIVA
jgi:hypothetical protein